MSSPTHTHAHTLISHTSSANTCVCIGCCQLIFPHSVLNVMCRWFRSRRHARRRRQKQVCNKEQSGQGEVQGDPLALRARITPVCRQHKVEEGKAGGDGRWGKSHRGYRTGIESCSSDSPVTFSSSPHTSDTDQRQRGSRKSLAPRGVGMEGERIATRAAAGKLDGKGEVVCLHPQEFEGENGVRELHAGILNAIAIEAARDQEVHGSARNASGAGRAFFSWQHSSPGYTSTSPSSYTPRVMTQQSSHSPSNPLPFSPGLLSHQSCHEHILRRSQSDSASPIPSRRSSRSSSRSPFLGRAWSPGYAASVADHVGSSALSSPALDVSATERCFLQSHSCIRRREERIVAADGKGEIESGQGGNMAVQRGSDVHDNRSYGAKEASDTSQANRGLKAHGIAHSRSFSGPRSYWPLEVENVSDPREGEGAGSERKLQGAGVISKVVTTSSQSRDFAEYAGGKIGSTGEWQKTTQGDASIDARRSPSPTLFHRNISDLLSPRISLSLSEASAFRAAASPGAGGFGSGPRTWARSPSPHKVDSERARLGVRGGG